MVNVAVVVLKLPHESVALNITVALPVAPQPSLSPPKLFDQITPPLQISLALAPPLFANHAASAPALPAPSHSTIESLAAVVISGAVVSLMVNVAVVVLKLPHESVALNVTRAEPVLPQPSLRPPKLFDQITPPLQISLALAPPLFANHAASAPALPEPSHSTIESLAAVVISGAVVSLMVNVAVVVLKLPHESVALNVTRAEPVLPQPSLRPPKLFDQITPPLQISLALAPPLFANHAANAAALPEPSHSTIESLAAVVISGAVVSLMVNVAVVVLKLPHESVALNVTRAEPVLPQPSLSPPKLFDQITPPLQISLALAPPLFANHAANAAALPAPSHSTMESLAAVVISGAVVSLMVKVAVVVLKLPQESVALNVTIALPVAPQPSLRPPKLFDQITPPLQISLALAPPLFANHAANAPALPEPSHSTIVSLAIVLITGAVVSIILKVAAVLTLLLQVSVAVNVTVAEPVLAQPSLNPVKSEVQVNPPEATVATAPP